MNCQPPSHSMWVCFFCCVRAFFGIGYRIIEFIGHLSFCKNILFFLMRILKKNGACFFCLFFCGGTRKKKYIFYQKKKEKKKKEKKSGNWDLISFPHCSSVIGFTDVCTHTFMLNCRLYNTWVSVHFCFSITVVVTIFVRRTVWPQTRVTFPFGWPK